MTTGDLLTISTTSTSASIRKWYRNIFRSFFIWIELSSIWATVKMRILQFFQVRCCFRRNGNSISRPPSWTIHQISMFPRICLKKTNIQLHLRNQIRNYLFSGLWEEVDAFRNDQRHTRRCNYSASFQESFPGTITLTLTPTIGPSKDHRVRFHSTQSASLNTKIQSKLALENVKSFDEIRTPTIIHRPYSWPQALRRNL